jgi:hypothetical protein
MMLQGIYRKPKLCRERHKFLSERLGTEIQENSDDVSPLQTSTAQPPGIPKVCFNWLPAGDFHMHPFTELVNAWVGVDICASLNYTIGVWFFSDPSNNCIQFSHHIELVW